MRCAFRPEENTCKACVLPKHPGSFGAGGSALLVRAWPTLFSGLGRRCLLGRPGFAVVHCVASPRHCGYAGAPHLVSGVSAWRPCARPTALKLPSVAHPSSNPVGVVVREQPLIRVLVWEADEADSRPRVWSSQGFAFTGPSIRDRACLPVVGCASSTRFARGSLREHVHNVNMVNMFTVVNMHVHV